MDESKRANVSRFDDAGSAIDELVKSYNAWTAKLGEISLQACYATIAAVWALFGTNNEVWKPENWCALWALGLAVLFVGFNLAMSFLQVRLLAGRADYARDHAKDWQKEFERRCEPKSQFPYTPTIELLGDVHHWCRLIVPLAAAGFLLAAVIIRGGR